MKMSHGYLKETVAHLELKGFGLHHETSAYGHAQAQRYILERSHQKLSIEIVCDNEGEHYYLEIHNHFGLSTFSFPLESWRHFEDRVEFKFEAMPDTGLGLSFTLHLLRIPTL